MKSDVSDLLELALLIYDDACVRSTVAVSDLRDVKTITSRVEKEGLSFLTITLPNFCRDFEYCLAIGYIDSTVFRSFRKIGAIPAFLQGMLSLLFDKETGRLLNDPDYPSIDIAIVIGAVRQVCRAFTKVKIECTPTRNTRALLGFVQTERDFDSLNVPDDLHDNFCLVAHHLWSRSLSNLRLDELWCSHGPGGTAEGISGNQKYLLKSWNERLEPYFPIIDNGYSISIIDDEGLEAVEFIPQDQESPVKVVLVPKTLKSPRVIAMEPVGMQYAQQAIRRELYSRIESSREAGGHINFSDQSVNQRMALAASIDGSLATVDLSEASDRVPHDLALAMFDCNPDLRDAINACRSTHAKLPNGALVGPLRKFASMGSALCFPVESMFFYTVCVVALLEIRNLPVTYANCVAVSRDVYIYGDDIIIPADETVEILVYLQKFNCKVNNHKTFWHGFFRESCGLDAYKGYDVTPVYIRALRPKDLRQASELISWCATAQLFEKDGYLRTAHHMYNMVERVLGPLPDVTEDSPALGRILLRSHLQPRKRYNRAFQRLEIRAWVAEPVYRTDELDGYAALQKSLLSLHAANPEFSSRDGCKSPMRQKVVRPEARDALHLERSARHGVAALKRRWVPA